MTVKRPHGRALTNKGCPLFQTFSRQSEGLATQDYCCCISSSFFFSCETMDLDQCCHLVVKLSNTKKNQDAYASGTLLQISGGIHTVKFASCTLYTYTSLHRDLQYGLGWSLHDILYALGSSFQINLWDISPQVKLPVWATEIVMLALIHPSYGLSVALPARTSDRSNALQPL